MNEAKKVKAGGYVARVLVAAMLCSVALAGVAQARDSHWNVNVDVGIFFDSLAPYGTWVDTDDYGWCWVPSVVEYDVAWRPYVSGGHWVWTDWGWTWVSYYDWGWAPYHYGRWVLIDYGRWAWVPGYVWAPAWVSWRVGGGYIGWYPLPPDVGFRWDVGIRYHHNHFRLGFYYDNYPSVWTFVPAGRFHHVRVANYAVPERTVVNIYNVTNNVTNIYYDRPNKRVVDYGPDVRYVERYAKRTIPRYRLTESSKIGQATVQKADVIEVYKPRALRESEKALFQSGAPDSSDLLIQSKSAQKSFGEQYQRIFKENPAQPIKVLKRTEITERAKEGISILNPSMSPRPGAQKGFTPSGPGLKKEISPAGPGRIEGPIGETRPSGGKPVIAPGMEKKPGSPAAPAVEKSSRQSRDLRLAPKEGVAPMMREPTPEKKAPAPAQPAGKKKISEQKQSEMEEKSFWSQPSSPAMKSQSQIQTQQKVQTHAPESTFLREQQAPKNKPQKVTSPQIKAQERKESDQMGIAPMPKSRVIQRSEEKTSQQGKSGVAPGMAAPGKGVQMAPEGARPGMQKTIAPPGAEPTGTGPALKVGPGLQTESSKPGIGPGMRAPAAAVEKSSKKQ